MVAVGRFGRYLIDTTEVTQREYARFLRCRSAAPSISECVAVELRPGPEGEFDPERTPELPVRDLSWCAAAAYCEWAGRRLCAPVTEWQPACTAVRESIAPAGMVRDPRACVLSAFADGSWGAGPDDVPQPVRSAADCRGRDGSGYEMVFDIIGNVQEFVTAAGRPTIVGQSWSSGPFNPCEGRARPEPHEHRPDVGIRCCAE